MPLPTGPTPSIVFNALYENLPTIVQSFVQYFFSPAMYTGAFFTGLLASTVFAGAYMAAPATGGDAEHFFFTFGVPAPNAGAGLGFLVTAIVAWAGYTVIRQRMVVK